MNPCLDDDLIALQYTAERLMPRAALAGNGGGRKR